MTETEWAKRNLEIAGWFSEESAYNGMIGKAVSDLLDTHQKEGHSGSSHYLTIALFAKVARGEALTMQFWNERFKEFNEFAKENGGDPLTEAEYEAITPKPKETK